MLGRIRGVSPFHVCGGIGLFVGVTLAVCLALTSARAAAVVLALAVLTTGVFLGLVLVTRQTTGGEEIVNYHHQMGVVVASAGLLPMLGQPVAAYLDLAVLGVGAFIACGRVGCLLAGCCYGIPARVGVRYGPKHVVNGLPRYLVDVPLVPVQLIESVWVAGIVVFGSTLLLAGAQSGVVFTSYAVLYASGRFWFEFLRGDRVRRRLATFSEAQWTSLIVLAIVSGLEMKGLLPLTGWHGVLALGTGCSMLLLSVWRAFSDTAVGRILDPRHVREVAFALDELAAMSNSIRMPERMVRTNGAAVCKGPTSCGLQLSLGVVEIGGRQFEHYAVSSARAPLTAAAAAAVADLIVQLRHPRATRELIHGDHGVVHVMVAP